MRKQSRKTDLVREYVMRPFSEIRARAAERKGGEAMLQSLLPSAPDNGALARIPDNRYLAEMAKRIFCAGFVWSVVEKKWPGFEEAFLGFEPKALLFQPDEFWERLADDDRMVRNGPKIMAVRGNAQFLCDIGAGHDSFGAFFAAWPATDQTGLLELLARRGKRLGGNSGQYFLRFVGRDSWIVSGDVATCLRDAGLDIAEKPTSKGDLKKIEAQFNAWAEETGLPLTHLSRICAMSVGQNYDAETLRQRAGADD